MEIAQKTKKTLVRVAYATVGILVMLFIVSLFLPRNYTFESSTRIEAPLECPFNVVNNLSNWKYWDPWFESGPTKELTYSDPAAGVGALCRWRSQSDAVGMGKIEIVQMNPGFSINVVTDKEGQNEVFTDFTFRQEKGWITVTRKQRAEVAGNPIAKYRLFFNERSMRKSADSALENMKEYCESKN